MTLYIGIDNGLKGGIVAINHKQKVLGMWVMPTIVSGKKEYNVIEINKIFNELKNIDSDIFVCLEKAHVRPVQGIRSAFSTGFCYGLFQGILGSKNISYEIVNPSIWMKSVFKGLNTKEKKPSIIWAQRKFPKENWKATERSRVIHDGLTDAAAIAYYCYTKNKI